MYLWAIREFVTTLDKVVTKDSCVFGGEITPFTKLYVCVLSTYANAIGINW